MKTNTATILAAICAAIILSVTAGIPPARAQTATCPCFTSKNVDGWFKALPRTTDRTKLVLACTDDPGFTTLDLFDRSPTGSSILIDVTYPTSQQSARCVVDTSPSSDLLSGATGEISQSQADACRAEILRSRAWGALGCPNN